MTQETTSSASELVEVVRLAAIEWRETALSDRLGVLRRFRIRVAQAVGRLGELVASPTLDEAEALSAEVLPFLDACRFLEREAAKILLERRVLGKSSGWFGSSEAVWEQREAFGVVGIIAPSNYRFFIGAVQVMQALVAGNGVLWKPGLGGCPAAFFLRNAWEQSGGISGVLKVLDEGVEAGKALVEGHPDLLVFTGSSEAGLKVAARCGALGIPTIIEASGCDAMFVLEDADLLLAAKALVFGLRLNAGRTCIAPRRVIVVDSVAEAFERMVANEVLAWRGLGWHGGAADRIREWTEEARTRGAVLLGGVSFGAGVCVYAGCEPDMRIVREDVHAPVAGILRVPSELEALHVARATEYGLGASVFSRDLGRARSFARRVQAGTVTINDVVVPTADARVGFGGWGRSGWGITRGREGLLSMTRGRSVHVCPAKEHAHLGRMRPSAFFFRACVAFRHGERPVYGLLGMLVGVWKMIVGRKQTVE
jgi:acyl-CoA reductase-like NAD-dependent aldehyde dehydrogenase